MLFMALLYWNYALVLPAIYQVRTGNYYWSSAAISDSLIERSSMVVLVSTVSMVFASSVNIGLGKRTSVHVPITKGHDVSAFLISLSVFIYAVALVAVFGWESYFLPRELAARAFSSRSGGSSILTAVAMTGPKAAAISALAITLYMFSIGRRGSICIFALFMAVLANFIVNFPLANARYFLVSVAFVVLGTIGLRVFRNRKNYIYILSPVLIYFAFPFLGQWNRGAGLQDGVAAMSISEYLSHGDMDGFQSIMNAVFYTDLHGFSFGNQISSSVLFFVPRSVWPGKSENSGSLAAESAGYGFLNISMPLPGEFFMDFGMIGVVVGMTVFGLIVKLGDVLFRRMDSRVYPGTVYATVFASFLPIIMRGPFLATVQAACVAVFIIVTWRTTSRVRTH